MMQDEQDEGQNEVQRNQGQRHPLPASRRAVQIPDHLFWQIGRPDDEELDESEVEPAQQRRKQELAQIANEQRAQKPGQRRPVMQQDQQGYGQRKRTQHLAADNQKAVN